MTPEEEKAKELVENYKNIKINGAFVYPDDEFCKQCAIIAVDEILQIVPSVYVTKEEEVHSGHYQYWAEVKSEIEKP